MSSLLMTGIALIVCQLSVLYVHSELDHFTLPFPLIIFPIFIFLIKSRCEFAWFYKLINACIVKEFVHSYTQLDYVV